MRLKTFYAKNMTEAMRLVRDTLGEDAVIIATREENGGKAVRVTAAIEQSDNLPDPYADDYEILERERKKQKAASGQFSNDKRRNTDYLQYDAEEDFEGQITEELTDCMLRHVVPNDVMDNILATAAMTGLGNAPSALAAALDHLYGFVPLPEKTRKAMMLVGPPGAGKTLYVAKMATQAVLNGKNVKIVTTDTVRAGGVEQLQAFTNLLDIKLEKAKTRDQLNDLLKNQNEYDLTIIDTAGTNPHDPDDMARIARLADAGTIDPILALTAGMDAEESSEIARSFALLGVQRMICTRLDVSRRLGGLLAAAQKGGMAFCNISFSPKVTDGVSPLNASVLASFLINADKALKDNSKPIDNNQPTNRKTAGHAS
jgi:flagellar biosynthesis protein FlhF